MSDNVLNTPGLMDPSTEFGNMMQTAMKIKGHQMEQDRRKFETFPTFLQNTMWMQGRPVELRELPIAERLPEATKFKEEGNELFRKKAYAGAIEQYESALGAFRYAKQLDPDWKKKGIKDETIDLIQDDGEPGTAEADELSALFLSCYNNLAACYLGRASSGTPELGSTLEADYKLAVHAATYALALQPANSKALYRRARALSEPIAASDADVDDAIRDLEAAAAADGDDRAVRSLLSKLKRARAEAKAKEKSSLTGLFGRGEIYDDASLAAVEKRKQDEKRLLEKGGKERTEDEVEAESREGEAAVAFLRERGRHADANALEVKVSEHRKQLDRYKQAKAEASHRRPEPIDFTNPTAQQVEDAKKQGIDLYDPLVVRELQRLQRREERGRGRRPLPPDVSAISVAELTQRLAELNVDYAAAGESRPELEKLLLEQYDDSDSDDDGDSQDAQPQTWARWAYSTCSVQ